MAITLDMKCFYEGFFDSAFKFPNIAVTQERKVEYYELEIFTECGGTAYINGESRNIRSGLCICARPGDVRYSELPIRCHYVKIMPELSEVCRMLDELPRFFNISEAERCRILIGDMLTARVWKDSLMSMARLLELISVIKDEAAQYEKIQAVFQKPARDAVETAITYMEEHFREKCTLESISEQAHFSPVYFHKIFKEAIGKTPYEYLSHLRINEAKRLLIGGNTNMTEIAEKSGFSSQAYFNYVFKKSTNTTPKGYRKKHIEKYSV